MQVLTAIQTLLPFSIACALIVFIYGVCLRFRHTRQQRAIAAANASRGTTRHRGQVSLTSPNGRLNSPVVSMRRSMEGSLSWTLMMSMFLIEFLLDGTWLLATHNRLCPYTGYIDYALAELLMLVLVAMCVTSSLLILRPSSYKRIGTTRSSPVAMRAILVCMVLLAVTVATLAVQTGAFGSSETSQCWFDTTQNDPSPVLVWFDYPNVVLTTISLGFMLVAVIGVGRKGQTPDQGYLAAALVANNLPYCLCYTVSEACFLVFNLIPTSDTVGVALMAVGCLRGVLMALIYIVTQVREARLKAAAEARRHVVVRSWA
ncbi:hypothetical protein KIPB_002012 [Kipferlia bialata]|uniref:Uncharacterized protein n=1 Tax=Kipferlia bialata TaxID=797122 RepID=A0A9K3GFV8_9EUKA|nr:hypothetical protein KIPB_002012 [Kipferlia bialata]|eukprot:g2012.t1